MIESEIVDGVWILRLNSPPLNTITLELLSQLRESIQQAGEDAAVKGIVITGDAAHFSAGADVNLFQQIASTEDAVRLCQVFQTRSRRSRTVAKPVVAALTGQSDRRCPGTGHGVPLSGRRPAAAGSPCRRSGWASILAPAGRNGCRDSSGRRRL